MDPKMNASTTAVKLCVYCGERPATEKDHVLARQFFPPEPQYRDDLITVPTCGICNRAKQKVEDTPGVLMQFCGEGPASQTVLRDRVPKTLRKNAKLRKELQKGMCRGWVPLESGLLVERQLIELTERQLDHLNEWYRFLTKGFHFHEFGAPLPSDHTIQLLLGKTKEESTGLSNLILGTAGHKRRLIANGEFNYIVAMNEEECLTMWGFWFCGVTVFAITTSPEHPLRFGP